MSAFLFDQTGRDAVRVSMIERITMDHMNDCALIITRGGTPLDYGYQTVAEALAAIEEAERQASARAMAHKIEALAEALPEFQRMADTIIRGTRPYNPPDQPTTEGQP